MSAAIQFSEVTIREDEDGWTVLRGNEETWCATANTALSLVRKFGALEVAAGRSSVQTITWNTKTRVGTLLAKACGGKVYA